LNGEKEKEVKNQEAKDLEITLLKRQCLEEDFIQDLVSLEDLKPIEDGLDSHMKIKFIGAKELSINKLFTTELKKYQLP